MSTINSYPTDGNVTMSGENYLSWSGDNNDAYSYIAAELNLTLL